GGAAAAGGRPLRLDRRRLARRHDRRPVSARRRAAGADRSFFPQNDREGPARRGGDMKFGVMLNHQYLADEDLGQRIEEGVETTELIRDLGYDLLFSHHHFLANMQTPQPIPILAHLVPFSGQMRLGIGVYIAALEHPVALAENFATLDQISGGRLVW